VNYSTLSEGVFSPRSDKYKELIQLLRESPLGYAWSFFRFIFMLLDYFVIGAIPLVGDILDLLDMIGGLIFVGPSSLLLLIEFIPVIGDFLPTELVPLFRFAQSKSKYIAIVFVVLSFILVISIIYSIYLGMKLFGILQILENMTT